MPFALSSLETHRFSTALTLLLSPLAHQDPEVWRNDVGGQLCQLVGADAGVLILEHGNAMRIQGLYVNPAAIRAYQAHYAKVDFGIARLRTLGVEVWSRRMLWDPDVLARSEYYNDFAVPNRLHGTVGLAIAIPALQATARAAFFRDRGVSDLSVTRRQLQMLALVLPAFVTGVSAHLRWSAAQTRGLAMLDDAAEPVALCDVTGRIIHANVALAPMLGGEYSALLRETIGTVARAVFAAAALGRMEDAIVRRVSAGSRNYDIRGTLIETAFAELPMALLVTVRRRSADFASVSDLRSRYNLTSRELEVADLLRRRRSNAEIARRLAISEHTARHHTERVLLKLGLHSRNDVEVMLRTSPNADGARQPVSPDPALQRKPSCPPVRGSNPVPSTLTTYTSATPAGDAEKRMRRPSGDQLG